MQCDVDKVQPPLALLPVLLWGGRRWGGGADPWEEVAVGEDEGEGDGGSGGGGGGGREEGWEGGLDERSLRVRRGGGVRSAVEGALLTQR